MKGKIMASDRIKLDDLGPALSLKTSLDRVRKAIVAYDPRHCSGTLTIQSKYDDAPGIFSCSLVMETLRPIERDIEGKLFKLGVDYGPSAVNPWEARKAVHHKVALEIQSLEGYRNYVKNLRDGEDGDEEALEAFEAKLGSVNPEDLEVFRDYVRYG